MLFKCGTCQQYKAATEFAKHRGTKRGLQNRCRSCGSKAARETYAKNPELYKQRVMDRAQQNPEKIQIKDLRQRAKYLGLDPDEIEANFRAHGGLCDICNRPCEETGKRYKRLALDHDHVTGEFRGFLCHRCNNGLGCFQDNPEALESAIRYLADRSVKKADAA